MAGLVLTFENDSHAIKAVGDITGGWQRSRTGHGFYGLGFLDFSGDVRMQVTLQVHARPNKLATFVTRFPRALNATHGIESLCYKVENGVIVVFAKFGENITWLENARKLGINWRPDVPVAKVGPISFYMTFLVVFTLPGSPGPGVTWEHDLLPFLSGQFESNRRRH